MAGKRKATGRRLPRPDRKVRVDGESVLIELTSSRRKKTNAYTVERDLIRNILDHLGQPVEPQWTEEWTEISPGIETRNESRGTRWESDSLGQESYIVGSLRIQRRACPVYVQFEHYREYGDYDFTRSSTDSSTTWVRYDG